MKKLITIAGLLFFLFSSNVFAEYPLDTRAGVVPTLGFFSGDPFWKIQLWSKTDDNSCGGLTVSFGTSFSMFHSDKTNYTGIISEQQADAWGDSVVSEISRYWLLGLGLYSKAFDTSSLRYHAGFDILFTSTYQKRYDPTHILASDGYYGFKSSNTTPLFVVNTGVLIDTFFLLDVYGSTRGFGTSIGVLF
jgi:hypothetical protein